MTRELAQQKYGCCDRHSAAVVWLPLHQSHDVTVLLLLLLLLEKWNIKHRNHHYCYACLAFKTFATAAVERSDSAVK